MAISFLQHAKLVPTIISIPKARNKTWNYISLNMCAIEDNIFAASHT
jgi:hypothetical protein